MSHLLYQHVHKRNNVASEKGAMDKDTFKAGKQW